MDDQINKPIVEIIQKSFFQTKNGKIVFVTSVVVIILAIIFINLKYVSQKTAVDTSTKITLTPNYGFKVENLDLPCPVLLDYYLFLFLFLALFLSLYFTD